MKPVKIDLGKGLAELQLTPDQIVAKAKPFLPYALAAVLAAFVAGYLAGPYLRGGNRFGGLTIAIPPLPDVEPLELQNISWAEARKANAAVPLSTEPIPAAKPFFLFNKGADRERAIDCLAATVYYEAGQETVQGQMAVIQVVLNRLRHPAYPKSVCGVVFQGHERNTGCQFSYTCDGSMFRRKPDAEAWRRYRGLARAMTNGMVYTPVGLATHYHTDWVRPLWSSRLDKVRIEGTHLFFRYHGYWGGLKAFSGRYAGGEPVFAKLGNVSDFHRTADTPEMLPGEDPDAALAREVAEITKLSPDRVAESVGPESMGKEVFILFVDPLLEPEAVASMAKNACGQMKRCKVLAWADPGLMPKGLPISAEERAAMAFTYQRDPARKGELIKWNCTLFPRSTESECFPGR